MKLRILIIATSSALFVGCAHSVHEVYVSDFGTYPRVEQGEMIKASAQQSTVMGFVTDTNYVNEARAKLIAQCPQGEISGITTQYSTSLGFFSWTNKILMQGLCMKPRHSASAH